MNTERIHKCWTCGNNKCSWSTKFIPVENWKARPSVRQGVGKTYTVMECPEYIYDGQCSKCKLCTDITQDNKKFCEHIKYNKEGECKNSRV